MARSSRVERGAAWTAALRYLVGNSWLVCATRHCPSATRAIRAEEFVQNVVGSGVALAIYNKPVEVRYPSIGSIWLIRMQCNPEQALPVLSNSTKKPMTEDKKSGKKLWFYA